MKVPRRLRGISGGRCCGGAPRPSGAGSTRHDGMLALARRARARARGGEDGGLDEESEHRRALHQPSHVVHEARVGHVGGLHAVDLDALARGQARRRRRASPGGGRRGRRCARRAGRRCRSTAKPSSVASMVGARARAARRRRSAIRSVSFSRSSCAPRTTVSPSAKQPSRATSGSSSMASGTSSALDHRADERARGRRRGREIGSAAATSSPGSSSRSPMTIAPMRCAMRTKPRARPVDADAAQRRAASPGTSTPAAMAKAALDGSPGTTSSSSVELVGAGDGDVAPVAVHGHPGGGQHALGVVAAGRRLGDRGGAVGGQAGEQRRTTSPARWPPAARSGSSAGARR